MRICGSPLYCDNYICSKTPLGFVPGKAEQMTISARRSALREKTLLFGGKKSGLSWKTVNRHCMQWGFFLFGQTQSQKHLYGRTGGKNHESNENKNVGGNGGAVSGSGTDGRMRRRGRCVQLRLGGHILRDGGCGFFRHIIGVGFCECVVGGGQRRGFSRLVRLLRGDGRGVLSPGASGIRGYDSYTGEPSGAGGVPSVRHG